MSFNNLVSWNVAGWIPTVKYIQQSLYGSLTEFLNRFQIDILALQETKVAQAQIEEWTATMSKCGFDSYWAPCITRPGFNGVATFVRKNKTDLVVKGASRNIFNITELDNEGRCILTDHADFVLLNVYVPNNGDGHKRLPFKLKFLTELDKVITKIRKSFNKRLILVGDFNLVYRSEDIHWKRRLININRFTETTTEASSSSSFFLTDDDDDASVVVSVNLLIFINRPFQ
jgi:exodeoxyribonuclease III